jgi:murein DD-endopeptidase MepM/ murein hydrolase activator NlpD
MTTVYEYLRASKGAAYKDSQVKDYSWIKVKPDVDISASRIHGNSRIHGDISPAMQDKVIDLLIEVSTRYKLGYRDIAHVLLMTKIESGFNPDAAAGTTSAAGLGQYTKATVEEAAKAGISKSRLGFTLDLSDEYVLDAERGAFGVLLSYMICKERAAKYFPEKIEENIYLFHHEGWYFNPDKPSSPERVMDVRGIIAKKISTHLTSIEKLLQTKTQVQFALKTADGKPYNDQPYAIVVPSSVTSATKNASPAAVQGTLKPKVIIGKTNDNGQTQLVEVIGLSEVVFVPFNAQYKKIISMFPGQGVSGSTHTVKKGETLAKISKDNGITVDQIAKDNQIKDKNKIAVGTELQLHIGEYWWRRPSTEWLSEVLAPHVGARTPQAVHAVVEHKRSHVSLPAGNKAHGADVSHNQITIKGSKTKAEVDSEKKSNKVPHKTNEAATVKEVTISIVKKNVGDKKIITGLLYPLKTKADVKVYHTGMGKFGSNRSGGKRKHAGIDLYASKGAEVRAMADGTVIQAYFFYCGTYAVEVDHGSFIARYGEVDSKILVKKGEKIKRGGAIGYVGKLIGIKVPSNMLHLEMYSSTESPLKGVKTALTQKTISPYLRRADIFDPTASIDVATME